MTGESATRIFQPFAAFLGLVPIQRKNSLAIQGVARLSCARHRDFREGQGFQLLIRRIAGPGFEENGFFCPYLVYQIGNQPFFLARTVQCKQTDDIDFHFVLKQCYGLFCLYLGQCIPVIVT